MTNYSFVIPIHSRTIIKFLGHIGTSLNNQGHQLKYIPQNRYYSENAANTLDSDSLEVAYLRHEPETGLDQLCEKYRIDSPREVVFPQMVYDRSYDSPSYRHHWFAGLEPLNYKHYINILHRSLDYLDILYEKGEGGIPLQWQGGEILRRALQRVADYHGHQSVRASFSPVPNKVLLRSTETMEFPRLHSAVYEEMTQEQRQNARDFRDTVIGHKEEVMGSTANSESIYENISRKIKRIKQYNRDIIPVAIDWLRRRIAKPALGAVAKKFYMGEKSSQEFINSSKYVFYPIQYFRESRVTMRAPEFYNQLWIIEYLSRSLPQGYDLVVKDHPNQTGALPLSHVRAINRYSNAIAPSIPARKVINHADAVVTLNNTVGYEALMFGKPVLTLGDAFYSGAGYTRDVSNLRDLPRELNKAVSSDGLSTEDVIEFSHGILQSSYEGTWGETRDENIEMFVNSILDFCNSCQK